MVPLWLVMTIVYGAVVLWAANKLGVPYDFTPFFIVGFATILYLLYWVIKLGTGFHWL